MISLVELALSLRFSVIVMTLVIVSALESGKQNRLKTTDTQSLGAKGIQSIVVGIVI